MRNKIQSFLPIKNYLMVLCQAEQKMAGRTQRFQIRNGPKRAITVKLLNRGMYRRFLRWPF